MNNKKSFANVGQFTTRAEGDDLIIEGYFAVFNSLYERWPGYFEKIDPEAFDGALDEDVKSLIDHDTAKVLARTGAGTLELKTDDHGLWGKILINSKDQEAVNLYERVKRRDVYQCSFGFDIIEEETDYKDTKTVVTIKKVKLYEVSIVTFPRYEETEVQARKKDFERAKERRREIWRSKAIKKLKGVI
nr:MAG TPA: prohead serine protease [Caudoviricetes sp.]